MDLKLKDFLINRDKMLIEKKTIAEKAVAAINQLNQTALLMHRQMKSGELNRKVADKAYRSARRKEAILRKAPYADSNTLAQLDEFYRSGLESEFYTASERFDKVLKHYAMAVGADLTPFESKTLS